jgi:hypothetical protein
MEDRKRAFRGTLPQERDEARNIIVRPGAARKGDDTGTPLLLTQTLIPKDAKSV